MSEYKPSNENGAKRYNWCKSNPDKIDLSHCMTCSEYYDNFKNNKPLCDIYLARKSAQK